MPVYNAAGSVLRSIASFQALSREINKSTLWVIDDCSTDGSFDLIQGAAKAAGNIRVIRNNENIGPGLSRNKALEEIQDGYIGFLDSDDEIIPAHYARSLAAGSAEAADFITFNGWTKKNNELHQKYDFDRIVDNTEQLAKKCIRGELDGSVIYSIYSAKLIQKNGLRFPRGYYEDIPFAYAAMLLANKRHISAEYSYQKNNRKGSIVNTITKAHIDGLLTSCVAVRRNTILYGLSDYADFKSDFIFGLHGYLAHAITSTLLNGASDDERISLLTYLRKKMREFDEFEDLPLRSTTKKDKLVAYYYSNYGNNHFNALLKDLTSYYEQLFGKPR